MELALIKIIISLISVSLIYAIILDLRETKPKKKHIIILIILALITAYLIDILKGTRF